MRILDAGCGFGRNLVYLMREGYEVFGSDVDAHAIESVRRLAATARTGSTGQQLSCGTHRDHVLSGRICRRAYSAAPFSISPATTITSDAMLHGTWRVLKPGGLLFCRLASSIGMETEIKLLTGRRYLLPDGSQRYLVDEAMLNGLTHRTRRAPARPAEDDGGAEPAFDDHVGGAEEPVTVNCVS